MLTPALALVLCAGAQGQRREPRRLFPVEGERGGVGFIDRAGRTVIPFEYAYGSSFSEGLAAVTTARTRGESGWGYIDHGGRVRIPLTLDYAEPFSGGLAAVDLNADGVARATDAYIDPHGRVVWRKSG